MNYFDSPSGTRNSSNLSGAFILTQPRPRWTQLRQAPTLIMALQAKSRANTRLPQEVNRAIYVRNLPFKISAEELYDLFGKYGPIRQIRQGVANDTKGTAFVVYEDIYDAANACQHLSGFNLAGRYLIVLYYQQNKMTKKKEIEAREADLEKLKKKHNV